MGKSLAHHEYARLFPMMDDDDVQELAADIAANGLRTPIVIDADDQILDGRNRAAACIIAGVEPVYEPFVGTDEEKLAFVISANIHRRHMTTSQRASVAAKLLPIYEAQAAKRQKETQSKAGSKVGKVVENLPQPSETGKARDKAAAAVGGVSGKAVDMAAKVQAKAIPEITKAVESGELAVSAAVVVADMPQEKQREIVAAGGPAAVRQAASEERNKPPKFNLLEFLDEDRAAIVEMAKRYLADGAESYKSFRFLLKSLAAGDLDRCCLSPATDQEAQP